MPPLISLIRMKPLFLLASLLAFFSAHAQVAEPVYTLHVDGKPYALKAGEELKLKGHWSDPVLKLEEQGYQVFDNGSISFRYPNYMARQEDGGIGYKTWTLDGKDFIIMLFQFEGKVAAENVTEQIKKKFGKKNCTETPIQRTIGNKLLDGTRLNIQIADVRLHQDFYTLPGSGEKMTSFLVFQSTDLAGGGLSEEEIETMKLFNASVRY